MGIPERPCWTTGEPPNRVAALPRGPAGRLGGVAMRLGNRGEQREIAAFARGVLRPEDDVVEVGCGPGVLVAELARTPAGAVHGLDPSVEMRTAAVRATARSIARGRVRVSDGSAERTGLPDACADVVVSVNTVAIWPDLDAGVAELHRVLRPGGTLVLSWHGGRAPSRSARSLTLPDGDLDRVAAALSTRFGNVRRTHTRRCTVFSARRAAGT